MTKYNIHFRSICRKLKKAKDYTERCIILENCKLTAQDKGDLYELCPYLDRHK